MTKKKHIANDWCKNLTSNSKAWTKQDIIILNVCIQISPSIKNALPAKCVYTMKLRVTSINQFDIRNTKQCSTTGTKSIYSAFRYITQKLFSIHFKRNRNYNIAMNRSCVKSVLWNIICTMQGWYLKAIQISKTEKFPNDAIWRPRNLAIWNQVMAGCLMSTSNYT